MPAYLHNDEFSIEHSFWPDELLFWTGHMSYLFTAVGLSTMALGGLNHALHLPNYETIPLGVAHAIVHQQ